MMGFKVIGIPNEISKEARETRRSPQYGHPAFSEIATGYGPCRSCLKTFEEGMDERLLFTYNAFQALSSLPLPGPVFIHTDDCEPFNSDTFPEELLGIPMLYEGFGDSSELKVRQEIRGDSIMLDINRIFSDRSVKYINIRNSEAGCFVARVERVD